MFRLSQAFVRFAVDSFVAGCAVERRFITANAAPPSVTPGDGGAMHGIARENAILQSIHATLG
jgi:hypothetical protein